MLRAKNIKLIKKAFTDKNGKVVVWQKPNLPLWGWFVFTVLSKLISKGAINTSLKSLSIASLIVWAVLEIIKGSSIFRRLLGFVVLSWMLYSHF
jgi:hypothetical protein